MIGGSCFVSTLQQEGGVYELSHRAHWWTTDRYAIYGFFPPFIRVSRRRFFLFPDFFILCAKMMRFLLLFSRQGKLRLQKWYTPLTEREKKKIIRDMTTMVLARQPRSCNFLHWKDLKIIYKRYASLYFCLGVESEENELLALEVIHRYVELLDKYFGNVCELDIIFNFEKAYFILDEFLMTGEVQETSKQTINRCIENSDMLQEDDNNEWYEVELFG
ncbi:hypothetical protein WMY93_001411 [Mugilogobius chulae]|uniref:AP complex mu/sigma subunit domain-containing protein n=1 Tax=Mugilogobius chulae TaxID=88201 RepID=A0AAW0Q363_9GOBI